MNSSHGVLHTAGLRHTCDSPRLGELFGPRGVWTCRSLGTRAALLCLVLQGKTSLLWAPDLVPARSAECRPKARKAERPFGSGGPVTVSPRLCFAVFALVGTGGGTKGVAWTAVRPHPTLAHVPSESGFGVHTCRFGSGDFSARLRGDLGSQG